MLSFISVLGVFGVLGVRTVLPANVRLGLAIFTHFYQGLKSAESPLSQQYSLRSHPGCEILCFTSHVQPSPRYWRALEHSLDCRRPCICRSGIPGPKRNQTTR